MISLDIWCEMSFWNLLVLTCWTGKLSWAAFGQEFSVWQHQLIRYRFTPWISRSFLIQSSHWYNTEVWKRDVTTSPRHRRNSWESLWRSWFSDTGQVFGVCFFPGGFGNWRVPGEVPWFLGPDRWSITRWFSYVGFLESSRFFACFQHFRRVNLNHKPQVFYRNLLTVGINFQEMLLVFSLEGGITHLTLVFGLKGPKQKTQNKNKLSVPRWSSREFGISGMCTENSQRKLLEEKRKEMLEMRRGKSVWLLIFLV